MWLLGIIVFCSQCSVLWFVFFQIPLESFEFLTRIHYLAANIPHDGMWGEHEIDHILFVCRNVTVQPNTNEVRDFRYVTKAELKDMIGKCYSFFTLAMLCASAVFAVAHPSITLVHCIHAAEDIVKLLSRPGRPITLVFHPLHRYPIQRGTLQRGRWIHRVGKIGDFLLKSPFISEMVQDRPMVTMEC